MTKITSSDDIQNLPKQLKYDPELLTFVDLKKTRTMSVVQMMPIVEKCITSWGFDIPFQKGALRKLNLMDSGNVVNTVLEGIGEEMLKRIKGINVDFRKGNWTAETLEKLTELEQVEDYEGMVEMFREVCEWSGGAPKDPMNCVDGGAAYKAIMDKWSKVISGKN